MSRALDNRTIATYITPTLGPALTKTTHSCCINYLSLCKFGDIVDKERKARYPGYCAWCGELIVVDCDTVNTLRFHSRIDVQKSLGVTLAERQNLKLRVGVCRSATQVSTSSVQQSDFPNVIKTAGKGKGRSGRCGSRRERSPSVSSFTDEEDRISYSRRAARDFDREKLERQIARLVDKVDKLTVSAEPSTATGSTEGVRVIDQDSGVQTVVTPVGTSDGSNNSRSGGGWFSWFKLRHSNNDSEH